MKLILKTQSLRVYYGFIWLRIETVGGLFWTLTNLYLYKMVGMNGLAERVRDSQEGFFSIKLFSSLLAQN
jgi:hypothetical protein